MWLSMDSRRLGVRRDFQKERGTSRWGPSVLNVPEPSHPQSVRRKRWRRGWEVGWTMDRGRTSPPGDPQGFFLGRDGVRKSLLGAGGF